MSVEQLAKGSALVVEARLARLKSYLSRSKNGVLTDYTIMQPNVVAGTVPVLTSSTPRATPQLILTKFGGEILLHGVTVRAQDTNLEQPIDEQATYLLFLMQSRAGGPGYYELYGEAMFEIRDSRVIPLARNGSDLFKWSIGTPVADVLASVRAAARSR